MVDLLPILLANLASFILAVNFYVQRQGLKSTDAVIGAFLSVSSMAALFWIFAPLNVQGEWFAHPSIWYFVIAGLTFPAIAQFLQIVSIGKVGPALTSGVGSLMPLFAAIPAVLFLNESFGLPLIVGSALMMSGVVIAGLGGVKVQRHFPLWALLLPVAASACRGVVQPLIKLGLLDIPSPYFATLVAGNVSTLVVFVIVVATGKIALLGQMPRGALWFVLVGVINGTGILLINLAVSLGAVTRVAPFVATVPLWVLLLGWAVFRVEKLGLRHLLIVALVMAGGILIATR